MKDKFAAVWLSHSSISDYLKCPRLYYLRNVYKDPKTGHKITIMQPPLALGQAVHDVVESLSVLPVSERLSESLLSKFDKAWEKVHGELGGFGDSDHERRYKDRGIRMLKRVTDNPGPILEKAVKIRQELPWYWFSEEENIILCGKIDWLQYNEAEDSVHILDFKTGKHDEDEDSLQLPIYTLLVINCQKRKISGASYWYLDRDDAPLNVELPDPDVAYKNVLVVAKKVALARKLNHFVCAKSGCAFCRPFERILKGEGKLVGESTYHQDIYIL